MPLPIVLLAALLKGILSIVGYNQLGENVIFLGIVSVWASIIAFIPYLILVAVLLLWMNGKTEKQIRGILALSPLVFVPIFSVSAILFVAIGQGMPPNLENDFAGLVGFLPLLLGYGYFYVILSFAAIYLLRKAGIIYDNYD